MSAVIVLGAQWGDEGKGKATDQLGQHTDLVVKFDGDNNAGHTVVIDSGKYALHLLPAGILSEGVTPVIGNDVAVDPDVFLEELADITACSADCSRLLISSNAYIIPPYNRLMDQADEYARGNSLIGMTSRGIDPTYAGKMNRISLRIQDLFRPEGLHVEVEATLIPENTVLEAIDLEVLDLAEVSDYLLSFADRVKPMLCDMSLVVNDALDCGDTVLFGGGQATMLDINYGTYPFVTSSSPTAGGALTGSGVGPIRIDRVVGVTKACTARVGERSFPTELNDEVGEALHTRGGKFSVITSRSRRTGWFDAIIMRYSTRISGLTGTRLTKLDILSGYETIPVYVAYEVDGVRAQEMPLDQAGFEAAAPMYGELPDWSEDISQCRFLGELPQATQDYIKHLEELSRCHIQSIGVDPSHEATIVHYPLM